MQQPIVIVGGGEFGLSAALAFALRSYKHITIYERLEIPAVDAASTDVSKIVRAEYGNDTLYQQMALDSIKIWKEWNKDCMKRFGYELYHETGVLMAAAKDTPESYESKSFTNLSKHGYHKYLEQNKDIAPDRFPFLKKMRAELSNGHYNQLGGWVDSSKSILYLLNLVIEAGVKVKTGVQGEVMKLMFENDQIIGITTRDGKNHRGNVILCTGAWSPSLLPKLRSVMVANGQPVVHLQAPLSLTDGLEAHQNPVWAADLANPKLSYYGFPPTNGIIKVAQHGAGYQSSRSNFAPKTIVSNPSTGSLVPLEFVKNVRGFFDQYFPQLANLDIVNTRICWYCDSFDGDFFIAKLPDHPQLLIAAGGSGHAFKFMPVLGNVIVDAFEGRKTKYTDRFKWRTKNDAIEKQESSRSTNSGQKDLDEIQLASSQDLLSRSKF